jgi:hypothetical protein
MDDFAFDNAIASFHFFPVNFRGEPKGKRPRTV